MGSYDQGTQFIPRLNPIPLPNPLSRKRALPDAEDDGGPPAKRLARQGDSIVYRLLVPSAKIGNVIGKQGARIRELREGSGAQIKITDPVSKLLWYVVFGAFERLERLTPLPVAFDEDNYGEAVLTWVNDDTRAYSTLLRHISKLPAVNFYMTASTIWKGEDRVIMISSKEEDIVDSCTAAEYVLGRVANMIVEELEEINTAPISGTQSQGLSNLLRLLIGRSQAGCLIGKGGLVIKEIREKTGAGVRILPPDQMPFSSCISDTDRLVQISGELPQVQEALRMVASKLRENPPKESVNLKPSYHQQHMRYAQAVYAGYGAQQYASGSNVVPNVYGSSDQQASNIAKTPKVTSEMRIPSAFMGGVIGRGGANITHVRLLSGCAVKVYDQEQGRTDRSITFEGTPEQVSAAQSLVQAFMNAQ